ncbi:hypothetical protein POK33_39175 [Burkholderia cenocepacia]|uniref:hypothetical protein n=1 Tax=Burkholderia cenocepacia TaxID=95486 RepID=UPI0023B8F191|nr:hypothetical protein [Burkholderia cenocepacia]MDF0506778.1 hypothetical protein [Burkholderia cenocepacia]
MTTENLTAATEQADTPDYFTRVQWHIQAAVDQAQVAKTRIDAALAKAEAAREGVRGREAEQQAAEQRIKRLEVFADAADVLTKEVQSQARNYAASMPREDTSISREEARRFRVLAEQTALRVVQLQADALAT